MNRVSIAMAGLLVATTALADDPRSRYVPFFSISTEPAIFGRDQPFTTTANFAAPQTCAEHGLVTRVYDLAELKDGEPAFGGAGESGFLDNAYGPFDPAPAAGTRVTVAFDPLRVPAQTGEGIYLVVWSWCLVRVPKGITPTGSIIWHEKLTGTLLGGATYHFNCPGGKTALCGYRQD